MLQVQNLTKCFGTNTAVDSLSFELKIGEVMGFIGPNGAGKSTTMRMITGFLPPTSGTVKVADYDVEQQPLEVKRRIGYLPENAPLYGNKTVYEFLTLAAELRGFRGGDRQARINYAVELCHLGEVRHQPIDTLSKGYRQRVCFAQAILHEPELLILDEPTDGLDPNQKREVRHLIKEMGKSKAIIISTHILEEIEAVTSRVLLISNGNKKFDGTPQAFKLRSQSAGIFILKLAMTNIEQAFLKLKKIPGINQLRSTDSDAYNAVFHFGVKDGFAINKLRFEVADLAAEQRWKIIEFSRNDGDLNEVFASLTDSSQNISSTQSGD